MNHKEITGFDTIEEYLAYEKGREDQEKVFFQWLEKWQGTTNSQMGDILMKKFKELKINNNESV